MPKRKTDTPPPPLDPEHNGNGHVRISHVLVDFIQREAEPAFVPLLVMGIIGLDRILWRFLKNQIDKETISVSVSNNALANEICKNPDIAACVLRTLANLGIVGLSVNRSTGRDNQVALFFRKPDFLPGHTGRKRKPRTVVRKGMPAEHAGEGGRWKPNVGEMV